MSTKSEIVAAFPVGRKPNVSRTGERLIRIAHDLETIAARLREAGFDSEASSVKTASRECEDAGRSVDRKTKWEDR